MLRNVSCLRPSRLARRAAQPAVLALALLAVAPAHADDRSDLKALIAAMTVEEKLALVRGAPDPENLGGAGYLPGVPRLGIPPLRSADGPAGIEVRTEATALPAPEAVAATFDPALAEAYGGVLGREARALGMDVVLAPHVNIARLPVFHRVKDEHGEDPLLAARMGAAEIRGIQAAGAMAEVKHLAANDQFRGQDVYDFRIPERALAEIHLPPFEAAVREAGVASVMCAYNRVNGPFSCAQKELMTGFLRKRWGFDGFVTSDWNGARSFALDAGLDVEMPGTYTPSWYGRLAAKSARDPAASARLDRAVLRVLGQMKRFGLLSGASPTGGTAVVPPRPVLDLEAGAAVARKVATAGAVLLKNDGLLPIEPAETPKTVLLVGPTAERLAAGAGVERAYGVKARMVSPFEALKAAPPAGWTVDHRVGIDLEGTVIPTEHLSWTDEEDGTAQGAQGHGLVRMPTSDPNAEADIDATLDFTGGRALPEGSDLTWAGLMTVPETGIYDLMLEIGGGSGRIQLGERIVASARIGANGGVVWPWTGIVTTREGLDITTLRVKLIAGHSYQVKLFAKAQEHIPLSVRFAWVTPAARAAHLASAIAAAHKADRVVVFAHEDGQPPDRETLALPADQNALIRALAEANPNLAVVVTAGRPVTMPWIDKVKAVLLGWYPGQEGGAALADLLTGRAEPGGRLPLTFPTTDDQTPARGHPERYQGHDEIVDYSEGLEVGYRWYDAQGETPMFPFGHGLGYTRFSWRDPLMVADGDGAVAIVTVKNEGARAGSDVVQVYLGRAAGAAPGTPPKALAGFTRVRLEAGAETRVAVKLAPRAFESWSEKDHAWRREADDRSVLIAASSRDIRFDLPLRPATTAQTGN